MRTFSTSWSHFWWWVHVESILLDIPVIVIWCWYCCLHCWSKFTALGHEHYRPRSFVWRCSSCRRVASLLRILKLSSTRTLAIISIAVHLVSWWCGNTDVYFSLTVITLVCTWQRDSTPSLDGFGHFKRPNSRSIFGCRHLQSKNGFCSEKGTTVTTKNIWNECHSDISVLFSIPSRHKDCSTTQSATWIIFVIVLDTTRSKNKAADSEIANPSNFWIAPSGGWTQKRSVNNES